MKVCLLVRSGTDSGDVPETHQRPDPSRYVDPTVHEIFTRQIGKETALRDIDQLASESFDIAINYLLHDEVFHLSWIEASNYLRTQSIPCIGTLPLSVAQLLADGLRHQGRAENSVDSSEVSQKAISISKKHQKLSQWLFSRNTATHPGDFTVLVVLIGRHAVALAPLEYKSLDGLESPWKLVQEPGLVERLEEAAVEAFNAIRGTEYMAYLRVGLRIGDPSAEITITSASPSPFIFHRPGNQLGDDLVVEKTFPGGHQAFFEVLLSTKLSEEPAFARRNQGCADQHDKAASVYYKVLEATNVTENRLGPLVGAFDYNGTVLDCCSGSGAFASYAVGAGVRAKFSAIDYSVKMTELPDSKALYETPILIGPVQEVLMQANKHDHVVCFGSFHLLRSFDFVSTVSQMFLRANRSVTFDVDDLSQTYIQGSAAAAGEKPEEKLDYNHNNVAAAVRFGTPHGWRRVYSQRHFAYHSPLMKEDVYTLSLRFERI